MAWVKIENNIVVQKQPYKEDGFIEVSDDVVCGQIKGSDGKFTDPVITEEPQAPTPTKEELLAKLEEIAQHISNLDS